MLVFYEYFWWVSNGSLSQTESNDTVAASAQVRVTGSASVSEAADTLTSAAQVRVTGSLSVTEAADTLSSVAHIIIHGTSNNTEAADTVSSAGVVVVHGVAVPVDIDTVLATVHNAAAVQSTQIVHFSNVPYITEDRLFGYVSSDLIIGVNETYYRQS